MNTINTLKLGLENISRTYQRHKPLILTVTAGGSSLLALYEMFKEGPKIKEGVSKAKKEFKEAETSKDKAIAVVDGVLETAISVAKVAIPETISIASMTESYKESTRRILALGTMAVMSQAENIDLKKAAKEVVGKKKAAEIEERVATKRFSEIKDDPTLYDDWDEENPDVFVDKQSGAIFRGKYIDVLNGINSAFQIIKSSISEGDPVTMTHEDFMDRINYNKDGNPVRPREFSKYFVFDPYDVKNVSDVQEFVRLVQIGNNRYEIEYEVPLLPNPDLIGDSYDFYRKVGDHFGKNW